MSRKTLITLGAIIAAIVLGTAVWFRSSESPSQTSTRAPFVPPTTDPVILAAQRATREACHKNADGYDPRTRMPDLAGCTFERSPGGPPSGDFTGRDFTGANFAGAYLADMTFTGANFTDANFTGAQLAVGWSLSDYDNANFTGANLTGARLPSVHLDGTNFTNANLSGAYFYEFGIVGEIISWATFTDVTWANTICPDGTNSDANGGTCADNLYVHPSHRPSATPTSAP